ncbi:MAG: hypothetical protein JRI63_11705 [Deltaproteobacteria bacterium]|nr:hypothetical protein [Deltaproteobacteria bacterium]
MSDSPPYRECHPGNRVEKGVPAIPGSAHAFAPAALNSRLQLLGCICRMKLYERSNPGAATKTMETRVGYFESDPRIKPLKEGGRDENRDQESKNRQRANRLNYDVGHFMFNRSIICQDTFKNEPPISGGCSRVKD